MRTPSPRRGEGWLRTASGGRLSSPLWGEVKKNERRRAGSGNQQQRLLALGQLHVEGRKQRRGRRVVAHQHDQLDQLGRREQLLHPRKAFRRDFVVAKGLPAELDDRRVSLVQALRALAMLDDVDDVG